MMPTGMPTSFCLFLAEGLFAPPAIYAPKVIQTRAGWTREGQLRAARNEFTILNRPEHNHIVWVLQIYQYKHHLNITMGEVADSDLEEYMLSIDGLDFQDTRKSSLKEPK